MSRVVGQGRKGRDRHPGGRLGDGLYLENVLALVLLDAEAELLRRQVHRTALLPDRLGDQLLG